MFSKLYGTAPKVAGPETNGDDVSLEALFLSVETSHDRLEQSADALVSISEPVAILESYSASNSIVPSATVVNAAYEVLGDLGYNVVTIATENAMESNSGSGIVASAIDAYNRISNKVITTLSTGYSKVKELAGKAYGAIVPKVKGLVEKLKGFKPAMKSVYYKMSSGYLASMERTRSTLKWLYTNARTGVMTIATILKDAASTVVKFTTALEVKEFMTGIYDKVKTVLSSLKKTAGGWLDITLTKAGLVKTKIINSVKAIKEKVSFKDVKKGVDKLKGYTKAGANSVLKVYDNISDAMSTGLSKVKALGAGVPEKLKLLMTRTIEKISRLSLSVSSTFSSLWSKISGYAVAAYQKIVGLFS